MRLFEIVKSHIRLRRLHLKNATRQIKPRLPWQLTNAEIEKIDTNLERAMIERDLGERKIGIHIVRIDFNRSSQPRNRMRCIVFGFS